MILTYIEWQDAYTNSEGWQSKESILEHDEGKDAYIIRQAGWVIKETDKYLIIADKWHPAEDNYADWTVIPKTWIRKRKEYKPR